VTRDAALSACKERIVGKK